MKKLVIYTTIGTILVVSGVLVTSQVNAQELNGRSDTFFSQIAEKLGVDEEEMVEVVDEVRGSMQAERQAERVELIAQAVEDGDLTERQAEILDLMEDVDVAKPSDNENWSEYTPEQREALRGAMHEQRQDEILDALYAEGLEVSSEELDDLHDVMEDLGIGMKGMRGEGGMGNGMGRGMHR